MDIWQVKRDEQKILCKKIIISRCNKKEIPKGSCALFKKLGEQNTGRVIICLHLLIKSL